MDVGGDDGFQRMTFSVRFPPVAKSYSRWIPLENLRLQKVAEIFRWEGPPPAPCRRTAPCTSGIRTARFDHHFRSFDPIRFPPDGGVDAGAGVLEDAD